LKNEDTQKFMLGKYLENIWKRRAYSRISYT